MMGRKNIYYVLDCRLLSFIIKFIVSDKEAAAQ
jgi:hypothetical protein